MIGIGYFAGMTRYTNLRQSIKILASSAEIQIEWLDWFFGDLTGQGSAEGYGNEELLLGFDDIYVACAHMFECGEITEAEIDASATIDELLNFLDPSKDDSFWRRESLFTDPRWDQIRDCSAKALTCLPDELRESAWTRQHWASGDSKAIPSK